MDNEINRDAPLGSLTEVKSRLSEYATTLEKLNAPFCFASQAEQVVCGVVFGLIKGMTKLVEEIEMIKSNIPHLTSLGGNKPS